MKNAAKRGASKRRFRTKSVLTLGLTCVGAIVFAVGAGIGIKNNSDWYSAQKNTIPASVQVTSFEERFDELDMGDAIAVMQCYHLVGTYENRSGEKSVIVLDEAYSDKEHADEQIGSYREVYLDADLFGASGISEVNVPDFSKSFIPVAVSGSIVAVAGAGLFLFTRKQDAAGSCA